MVLCLRLLSSYLIDAPPFIFDSIDCLAPQLGRCGSTIPQRGIMKPYRYKDDRDPLKTTALSQRIARAFDDEESWKQRRHFARG